MLPEVGSRIVWPGAIAPSRLGGVDHRLRDPVLDRAGRVAALELGEDAHARLRREPRQLDQRRVADRLEDVLEAAPAGAVEELGSSSHRFRKCSERRRYPACGHDIVPSGCTRRSELIERSDSDEKTRLWPLVACVARPVGGASPPDAATMTTTVATAPRAAAAATSARSPRASCSSAPTRRIPPFEIGQPPDISGFDIEVMDAIAEDIGLEVTYQDTGFDTIFRDTANGQFDTAAAASTITPERAAEGRLHRPLLRGPAGARGRRGR